MLKSFALLLAVMTVLSSPSASVRHDIATMREVAETAGDAIWPGYGAAPFGVMLITEHEETLLCEDRLPQGFDGGSRDPTTGCDSATRPRSGLPDNLLAAMPVFGRPSTIVMGHPPPRDIRLSNGAGPSCMSTSINGRQRFPATTRGSIGSGYRAAMKRECGC